MSSSEPPIRLWGKVCASLRRDQTRARGEFFLRDRSAVRHGRRPKGSLSDKSNLDSCSEAIFIIPIGLLYYESSSKRRTRKCEFTTEFGRVHSECSRHKDTDSSFKMQGLPVDPRHQWIQTLVMFNNENHRLVETPPSFSLATRTHPGSTLDFDAPIGAC
jgi:hypothetical protein